MKKTIHSNKEAVKKCTKFWQTPITTQESPINNLNEHNVRKEEQSKIKGTPVQDFHEFMNKEMSKIDDLEMLILDEDEDEKENLELLTDELIQVFNLNNIDKSSDL